MTPADPRIIDSAGGTPFVDDGDHGRVLIPGAATDHAYSLMELTVAPRPEATALGPHRHHDIDEVFVVRRGTIEFLLDGEVTTLAAGDVVRVPAGTRHGYRNISTEPVDMLVWFAPGGFEQLFVTHTTDRPGVDPDGFRREATTEFNSTFEG